MKQIIILETERGPGGDRSLRCAFWFAVPLARRRPNTGAASAFGNASAAEISEIQSGAVIEQLFATQVPQSWTVSQIKAALESEYAAKAAALAALPNPNQFYGTFWDGSSWSA